MGSCWKTKMRSIISWLHHFQRNCKFIFDFEMTIFWPGNDRESFSLMVPHLSSAKMTLYSLVEQRIGPAMANIFHYELIRKVLMLSISIDSQNDQVLWDDRPVCIQRSAHFYILHFILAVLSTYQTHEEDQIPPEHDNDSEIMIQSCTLFLFLAVLELWRLSDVLKSVLIKFKNIFFFKFFSKIF